MQEFLPKEVFDNPGIGEFRNVVSVFLSFTGVDTHEALDHFATVILEQKRKLHSIRRRSTLGTRAASCSAFSARRFLFNNVDRALEYVTAVQDDLMHLENITGARYRIGITSGTAFTGVIGSKERCQYAAVGARVNLAARLMMKAEWGEVIADENVQRNRNFKFAFRGEGRFKGFEESIPTYALSGRNLSGRTSSGNYFGRQSELKTLVNFMAPLRRKPLCRRCFCFWRSRHQQEPTEL